MFITKAFKIQGILTDLPEGVLKLVEIEVVPRVCYTFGYNKNQDQQRGGTTMGRMPHLVRERKKAKKLEKPSVMSHLYWRITYDILPSQPPVEVPLLGCYHPFS